MAVPTPSAPTSDHVAGRDDAAATVVPLVAETIEVATETGPVGAIRVRVEVENATERVGVDLTSEQYRPTVRPVGLPASERLDPYRDGDGDDIVIPVYEERVVVERRLFLKEEVRLSRMRRTERREGEVAVRRERAVLERQQPDGSWRELPVGPGAPLADARSSSPCAGAVEADPSILRLQELSR